MCILFYYLTIHTLSINYFNIWIHNCECMAVVQLVLNIFKCKSLFQVKIYAKNLLRMRRRRHDKLHSVQSVNVPEHRNLFTQWKKRCTMKWCWNCTRIIINSWSLVIPIVFLMQKIKYRSREQIPLNTT